MRAAAAFAPAARRHGRQGRRRRHDSLIVAAGSSKTSRVEAAALVREAGLHGLGVGAVMARAGLTHGGFYAHFASRDELLAETVSHMATRRAAALASDLDDTSDDDNPDTGRDPRRRLRRYVRAYLSWAHCEGAAGGCPLPLLASEAGHLPEQARARSTAAFETLVAFMARAMTRTGLAPARVAALAPAVTVQMIGAVAAARALPDRPCAEALLASVRTEVLDRLGLALEPEPEPGPEPPRP